MLPLSPLADAYLAAPPDVGGPVVDAVTAAHAGWLRPGAVDALDEQQLAAVVTAFAAAVHPLPFHLPVLARRVRLLRHSLNHLLYGQDPLPDRLARCVTPDGIYSVAGLGPTFWTAVVKGLAPPEHPLWCPATEAGLIRLGLLTETGAGAGPRFDAVRRGYDAVRATCPTLRGWQLDDFLVRVGRVSGRELSSVSHAEAHWAWCPGPASVRAAIRDVRVRTPLRTRLREAGDAVTSALARFQGAAHAGDFATAHDALRTAFADGRWELALGQLDDAYSPTLSAEERARLVCEAVAAFREQFRIHPLELADVIVAAADPGDPAPSPESSFHGFCTDTFRVLAELPAAGSKAWMAAHRDRYQFVLREPLVELCAALATRYVHPVLGGEYGWDMETDAKAGRALTSICKNDFGRSGPYQPVQWVTFYRRAQATRQADAQFFVRVAADGVRFGFHLGRSARDAGRQFRGNVQEHAEAIHAALAAGGSFDECRFWADPDLASKMGARTPADLREWATHKTIAAGKFVPPDAALLRCDELVGEILLTFDRLVPLFACAAEADPRPLLARRAGSAARGLPFDRAAFSRETFLSDLWLDRVLGLLRLKRQLVLQGVPGTGKTHVARCLARFLSHDRPENVCLVQFHPAYSYEEFVEGVRVRTAEVNGRSEVTFPVEDGVLRAFAEQAARRPSEPHVLVIDELNRGNLPRIFGELLYLLEYRDQAVTLPYSKRLFRLPDNLYVVATMNAADRSAVALDHALRRRFSFVDMSADPALLAGWLERHPPADPDETFGPRVVRVFEELNRRLARDLGPDKQVGHSFLMVPDLDAVKLSVVWDHHVRPLLLDYLGGRHERLAEYDVFREPVARKTRANKRPA